MADVWLRFPLAVPGRQDVTVSFSGGMPTLRQMDLLLEYLRLTRVAIESVTEDAHADAGGGTGEGGGTSLRVAPPFEPTAAGLRSFAEILRRVGAGADVVAACEREADRLARREATDPPPVARP